jgi:hypothetical protein
LVGWLVGWLVSCGIAQLGQIPAKNLIFGRESNLYLCLYNQLFALFHYVLSF